MSNLRCLSNGQVTFGCYSTEICPELFSRLSNFLHPFFRAVKPGEIQFSIRFMLFSDLPELWKSRAQVYCAIRKSTAAIFNLWGRCFKLSSNEKVVIDDVNQTAYRFDSSKNLADIYVSEKSFIHLIEFIRYLVLLIEESYGTTIFHASAAAKDENVVLICGQKGAGKTSTLLSLINSGMDYFSGDKVLIHSEKNGWSFRGWPDYPHIGVASLQNFPKIAEKIGVFFTDTSRRPTNPKEKILIDPMLFRQAVNFDNRFIFFDVKAIIFPNVLSDKNLIEIIPQKEKTIEEFRDNIEFPSGFTTVKWHNLFDSLKDRPFNANRELLNDLCEIPWIKVSGNKPLTFHKFEELIGCLR